MYTPYHRLLHTRWLYERVHAQHHEARFPSRGYADAANEHLLEQVGALSIHFAALRLLIALDLLDDEVFSPHETLSFKHGRFLKRTDDQCAPRNVAKLAGKKRRRHAGAYAASSVDE